jgi:hypothetical protein
MIGFVREVRSGLRRKCCGHKIYIGNIEGMLPVIN